MGGRASNIVSDDVDEVDSSEVDIWGEIADKLILLKKAISRLHCQYHYFEHVQKFRNRKRTRKQRHNQYYSEAVEKELKLTKTCVTVVYECIKDFYDTKYSYIPAILYRRIKKIEETVAKLMEELDEFSMERGGIDKMDAIDNLMDRLVPDAVPIVGSLQGKEEDPDCEETDSFLVSDEEETEILSDPPRIHHGELKLHEILLHHVVLFIDDLDDQETRNILNLLNRHHVGYVIFDVATDPEVRVMVENQSDCETFPQCFVENTYRSLADLSSSMGELPKLCT